MLEIIFVGWTDTESMLVWCRPPFNKAIIEDDKVVWPNYLFHCLFKKDDAVDEAEAREKVRKLFGDNPIVPLTRKEKK